MYNKAKKSTPRFRKIHKSLKINKLRNQGPAPPHVSGTRGGSAWRSERADSPTGSCRPRLGRRGSAATKQLILSARTILSQRALGLHSPTGHNGASRLGALWPRPRPSSTVSAPFNGPAPRARWFLSRNKNSKSLNFNEFEIQWDQRKS